MLCFLPLVFLFLCSLYLYKYLKTWRRSILYAAIITATALTVITEISSLFGSFSFYTVFLAWSILILIAAFQASRSNFNPPAYNFPSWPLSEKLLFIGVVFIVITEAITAAISVPNTWDSMTYHLPRLEHWIQNRTIKFYPTNIIRQLYITPWAEFAMAQLRLLGGGERSANFIQWLAMLGTLLGISSIAELLGANRRGQLISLMLAASLPMGILQSVSTQTDYTGTFWLVCFVYFLIEIKADFSILSTAGAGLALGLSLLTKGINYVFAMPFLVWFLWGKREGFQKKILGLLLMTVCVASLNIGQYARNYQAFGCSSWTNMPLTNENINLKTLEANVLRNASIHLATPFIDANGFMEQIIKKLLKLSGTDINDSRSSVNVDFSIRALNFDEDYAGNLLHAILFMALLVLLAFYRNRTACVYAAMVSASFLLFCLIIRYQPWNSRFHLALFVLFCPVAAVILENLLKERCPAIALVLLIGSMPYLFLNPSHPWIGKSSLWHKPKMAQYFYKRPGLAMPYFHMARFLKALKCTDLGLAVGEDSWEYPWWVLMSGKNSRIEHVGITNLSSSLKYPIGEYQPCAIIAADTNPPFILQGGSIYTPVVSAGTDPNKLTMYLKT